MSDEKIQEVERRKARKRVERRTADVVAAAREACAGDFRARKGDLVDAIDDLDESLALLAALTPTAPQLALDTAPASES